jgi:hypothetical protein
MHISWMWIAWTSVTVILNAALTIQSRAKNSSSLGFNFWVSWISGILFISSIGGGGQELLNAKSIKEIFFVFFVYGLASAVGSTIGQALCLKISYLRKLEQNHGHR